MSDFLPDACYVELSVLNRHQRQVQGLLILVKQKINQATTDGVATNFQFYNVSYGMLGIEQLLRQNGIPFFKYNSEGDNYDGRFALQRLLPNGELAYYEVNENDSDQVSISAVRQAQADGTLEQLLAGCEALKNGVDWAEQDALCDRLALSLPEAQDEPGPSGGPRI